MPETLSEFREGLLAEIRKRRPKEPLYLMRGFQFVDVIKYLWEDGGLTYPSGRGLNPYVLRPDSIDEMPVEALVGLLACLKQETP